MQTPGASIQSPLSIVIRTDASNEIGSGHVMRCLTLARALSEGGNHVIFLCRKQGGDMTEYIRKHGFDAEVLPETANLSWSNDAEDTAQWLKRQDLPADWIVVDHYALDARWERLQRLRPRRIMVIDDLANRAHDCDVFLDQTFGEDGSRYRGLIPTECQTLYGSSYALLRAEFSKMREDGLPDWTMPANPSVHVFFGSADPRHDTVRFSRLLLQHFPALKLIIVAGLQFDAHQALDRLIADFPGRVERHFNTDHMAATMRLCSVAIGAPGITTWERACLGLPAAYLAINPNQEPLGRDLAQRGLCDYLGSTAAITDDDFIYRTRQFLENTERLKAMRKTGLAAIDGQGASRVAKTLTAGALV